MNRVNIQGNYFKFFVYLVVIILINLVGVTLFFRLDLTQNKLFSLSGASHKVVETLSEPLTIKVFFTKNLPAPHNTTERYLHDLLAEYSAEGGRLFNYKFYDVTAKEAGLTDETDQNRKIAEDYGISPVQIRIIENDEVKFSQAYMGLVIIHGDMIEKLPALTATDGLEYRLTTAIQKLNSKVSALLSLKERVKVTLYLSSSLADVAPLIGLGDIASLPQKITGVVERLSSKSLDKIDFNAMDPALTGDLDAVAKQYNIMILKWPAVPQQNIKAGSGGAGIVMAYKDRFEAIPLISSVNLPIIGTTYQMADPEALEDILAQAMERMIGINQDIGYLADHGTPAITSAQGMGMMPGQARGDMTALNELLSKRYSVKEIKLAESGIPEGLGSLIIARPTEPFTDYELFQIDQALMNGTNLAIFPDAFNEVMTQQPGGFGGGPQYIPIDSGLSKLLAHYGVTVKQAYVMDENCYKQVARGRQGPEERNIYFAPMIAEKDINNTPGYMKNIKGLVAMKISPLELDTEAVEKSGITAEKLYSSSEKAWEMADNINLNPMFLRPPAKEETQVYPLAYMLEGNFSSYFTGKALPEKKLPDADEKEGELPQTQTPKPDLSGVEASNRFIETGKPGKLFVMACASMLQDTMLDPEGRTTNATFILNIIDHLNNRDEIASLRSKNQTLNPLGEISPFTRSFIKLFNIALLPVLVVGFGFGVWLRRQSRKKQIKLMFQNRMEE